MRAEQIWTTVRSVHFAVRSILLLLVILAYVNYVLAQLPATRGFSQDIISFVTGPLQVMGAEIASGIPSLVFLAVLFVVVRLALRILRLFFDAVSRGTVRLANFDPDWATPTYKLARVVLVIFALIVAYPYVPGSGSDAFKGISIFVGVVFSLGSSSALANILAGYMITYRRALKVGDRVKIGDAFGDVIETRLQVTHVCSVKNEEIIIPNSQILNGEVVNYSSLSRVNKLILHTDVGIGYETPWRQVEAMLIAAALRTDGLLHEPPPFVLEKSLGDFAVVYELNAYCDRPRGMVGIYGELHRQILDLFNEHGVQIMTPAYIADPSQPKVVPHDQWYAAPARPPSPRRPSG
jgi:small-conductance mechanosensitive channel